ncbi:MAG: hypothetical protein KDJ65_16130 [Anaerolineae bacterium]|nr:hypothetical protein [Anaerolineae bacterium]
MIFNNRWLPVLPVAVLFLLLVSAQFAFGQGPILSALPTPTSIPVTPDGAANSDPISAEALPDLIVTNVAVVPTTPKVDQPAKLSVTIKNQGSVGLSSENNFLVDLYIDPPFEPIPNYHQIENDDLPWGIQWFWVPPGGSYVLETTWVFTDVKTFEVWAQVDSGDDVVEANEDNNTKKFNVSVLTEESITQDSHQDFMANMASTLDNSDPTGLLRLGPFQEPPFLIPPFANGSCEITNVSVTDYNMKNPDTRIHASTTGKQEVPHLIDNGAGVLIAVWEDSRNGETNRDIYIRYSTNSGVSWTGEQKVNDDTGTAHQLNPVAALSDSGTLMVAWQDYRNGNYDIYAQSFTLSGANLMRSGSNILVGGSASYNAGEQINPDIAVDESGGFHVAWQDKRNGHYDIFTTSYLPIGMGYSWTQVRRVHDDFGITQQVNPTIQVLDWLEVISITYDVAPTEPYTITVNEVISQPATIMAVTWEDDRHGASDIAMVFSGDRGETFAEDQFLTNSPTDGDQGNPEVTLTKGKQTINFTVPLPDGNQSDVEVDVPISHIHTVWEGYQTSSNNDRNILYNKSQISVEQLGSTNEFEFVLSMGGNEQINNNDARSWQTSPVDQRDPTLVAAPCGGDTGEDAWNVFIAWSDSRNYDDSNYDIYYDLKSSCSATSGNRMLNDGVRLHNFDTTNPSYSDYDRGHPPPGRQLNPSIAADIQLHGSVVGGGYLYLVWEDDRAGNPQKHKDIYFARTNLTYYNQKPYGYNFGAGSQISSILDSGSTDTTWFTLGWSAITPASTYITVQTRMGDTKAEVLAGDWYPKRYPYQPQPWDCSANETGAPLAGYNAPGQHIEDAAGNTWPKARYIQYRVNFFTRDETKSPKLDNLTLYYSSDSDGPGSGPGSNRVFLPIVVK